MDMGSRTRTRGFTFLQVSGLHIPLFWKILPLDVHVALSLPPFKFLLKCPYARGLPLARYKRVSASPPALCSMALTL